MLSSEQTAASITVPYTRPWLRARRCPNERSKWLGTQRTDSATRRSPRFSSSAFAPWRATCTEYFANLVSRSADHTRRSRIARIADFNQGSNTDLASGSPPNRERLGGVEELHLILDTQAGARRS